MKLFRQAYEQDNGLPVGYTEVEYLESTGKQYIDTGIYFDENTRIAFKSRLIYQAKGYPAVYGARIGSRNNDFQLYYNDSNVGGTPTSIVFRNGSNQYQINASALGITDFIEKDIEVKTTQTNLIVNGYTTSVVYTAHRTPYPVVLFGQRGSNSMNVSNFGSQRIYYFKIYDNDTLIRDFIPCIDPLGVPCMYDLVSKKAYYNQGTGDDFIVGRHIIPVEYLESKGTQYIDTGLRLTQNNAIGVCYKINSISGFSGVVGARTTASSNNISVNANTGGSGAPFISVDFNNSNFETYSARNDDRTSDKILVYLDKHIRKISINNSVVVSNNTECNDTIKTQSNCLLFRAPGINGYCDLNMYYCKIWDGDTLVRDYIPAVDENGVGYMFDKVTHTAYLNAGSGNFICGEDATKYKTRLGFVRQMGGALRRLPKGFTEVEYLESDSTAYIDTGVSGANNNLKIEMDFSYSKFYSYAYLFSNYESEQHNTTRFVLDSVNNSRGLAYINTRSASGAIYPSNLTMNDKHSLILTKTTCSLDGVIATNPNPPVGTANTKSIVLFNRGVGSYASTRDIGMRCYYFRIYDNNTLVRHFIPCLDASDTPCMYDIVEGKAYYNKGTGTFLYGDKKEARYLAIPKVRLEVPAIYKKLKYLESTGKQYINTGIIGTNANMGIDVDWAFSNNNTNMCIFLSLIHI